MGKFSRAELEAAFEKYKRIKDECSRTGNWSPFADQFTKDCYYVEHAYGEFHGREQVRRYIVNVMAPYTNMSFPFDWSTIDEENGAIIFQVQNAFPKPFKDDGTPFMFPNITRLVYAGNGLLKEEQDWYNPKLHAGNVVKAWIAAGGKFESKEKLVMMHDKKRTKSKDGFL
mmetsp:Transcript_1019/g.1091  ORF Transcript_1019/g.1091 Transcript_1019/m.1091 type:complete len:171 (-) Transcript_1019:147-659(-)|eukprot:CAMPEP_0184008648 /NCGR_PEP_ID=MMETSP0954-20121128/2100_1 /TAXON_ID=627963 /ORGANISM="Aplanochytrium sp, Strain PBS07" /LENGTH=170 /DNA_ID=CAMNT_0026287801 /DNA_START=137 /DNA_END=649 /DNA_ORIENTATION=-